MSKRSHHNYKKQPRYDLNLIISLVIIMVTTLGTTIPMYINTSNQIQAIHDEIKDFHGRLCAIEERTKNK